ncbi:GumC family protein [Pedobacter sp. MW01-1-1]|uniref:GumC family protein n=1 Tax=Pedobacter sp. MW01-1-1 TaxID=3383027 RepID=UPI003FEEA732
MSPNNINTNDDFFIDAESDTTANLKVYIDKAIANWHIFLLSAVVCVFLAFVYAKFAPISYQINGKVLVKDDKSNGGGGGGMLGDMDLGSLLGSTSNAENEIQILKSRSLMTKVVKALQLNVTHGIKGNVRALEVNDARVPYTVSFVKQSDTIEYQEYTIDEITSKSFHIQNSEEDIDTVASFGKDLVLPQYTLRLSLKLGLKLYPSTVYRMNIVSVDAKVEELIPTLDAALTTKQSTVIDLGFKYSMPLKGEQILQTLMDLYLRDNLEDKQRIADSTINFIDTQLAAVKSDLKGIEGQIEAFKEENELANIEEQSKELVGNASEYYKKVNEADMQLNILKSISTYVNNPKNKRIIPSSLNVADPVFTAYLASYNELIMQRDRELLNYTTENPIIQNLDAQIESARQNLVKSFNAYRDNLIQAKREIDRNNQQIANQIKKVPKQERVFLDFSRQQNVRQQLYMFLLEKREETAIGRTSTIGTSQIIDPAKSENKPFKPKKSMIYLIGLLAGLALPFGYLSIKELLNTRIVTKKDITNVTSLPIIGEISHNETENSVAVTSKSRSIISEQFRGLRTNLQFMLKADQPNVLMVTSSMSGEGKSFISLNLGLALAISNKKVVLIELDLRKPKLTSNIGLENKLGFSNFIVNDKLTVADIVTQTDLHPNVSLISSGPIPPNPAELILSPKLSQLIEELKKSFDYVIIDNAPVGLVADALLVEKYTDMCLYITRQNVTHKAQLSIITDLVRNAKIRKAAFVVNDINDEQYSYYGSGYGYGYGYGDYAMESKKSKWWNLKKRFLG